MSMHARLTSLTLCAALLIPAPTLAAPAEPPASAKCDPKKEPAQATKRNGKVVAACVKPGTVAVETATGMSDPTAAPVAAAAAAVPALQSESPTATAAAPVAAAPAPAQEPAPAPAVAAAPVPQPAVAQVESNEPVVVRVPMSNAPMVPSGLKTTCMTAANTFDSDGMCPVVQYKGLTTWAYSYIDNRMSIALVTYDSSGSVVRNTAFDGARYVWQITLDPAIRTAKVWGQGSSAVSAPWSLFAGEALPAPVAAPAPQPVTATPVISMQAVGTSATAPISGSVLDVGSGMPAPCAMATNSTTSSSNLSATIQVAPTATSGCP